MSTLDGSSSPSGISDRGFLASTPNTIAGSPVFTPPDTLYPYPTDVT